MISNYKCTFDLKEGKGTSVTQGSMPSQREQYGVTVHLFIGTGRSPGEITSIPLNVYLQATKANMVYLDFYFFAWSEPKLLSFGIPRHCLYTRPSS